MQGAKAIIKSLAILLPYFGFLFLLYLVIRLLSIFFTIILPCLKALAPASINLRLAKKLYKYSYPIFFKFLTYFEKEILKIEE